MARAQPSPGNAFAGDLLERSAAGYAGFAASLMLDRDPGLRERQGPNALVSWRSHLTQRVLELAAAVLAGDSRLFLGRVTWSRKAFRARGQDDQDIRHSIQALRDVLVERLPKPALGLPIEYVDLALKLLASPSPAPDPSDLAIALKPVLEEGRHRRELWTQLGQRFASNEITFRLTVDPVSITDPAVRQILDLAAWGKTLAGISLETRRSEYETTLLLAGLCDQGILALGQAETGAPEADPVGIITTLLAGAEMRKDEGRFDAALEAYEKVLTLDGVNQAAKKGLLAVAEARQRVKAARKIPLDKVPVLRLTAMALSQQHFDPQEGFVLSRINGQWDVRSLLKLVPMPEDEVLLIFTRLLERQVIDLK